MHTFKRILAVLGFIMVSCSLTPANAVVLPDPVVDAPLAATGVKSQSIVVAGGCFWGIQAVYQHMKGVQQATSGYAGGDAATAHYNIVGSGSTGHAESVQVIYDPAQVTLGQILKVFFSVAHNPTELNFQGPDHGTQYRSAIFFASPEQQKIATDYIAQLDKAQVFDAAIVTKLEPLKGFYAAEDYHQDYAKLNPNNPYIVINDAPKVVALEKTFPDLYAK